MSMLFDADLSVPAKFNPVQLPQRVRAKSTTPFSSSVNAKSKSLQIQDALWSPDIPEFSSISESSAAAIGCKKPGAKKTASPPTSPVPLDESRDPLSIILENGDSDFLSPPRPSASKRQRASSLQSDLSNALTTSVQPTPSLEATSSIDDPAVVCSQSTVKRRGRPRRTALQVTICVTVILVLIFCLFLYMLSVFVVRRRSLHRQLMRMRMLHHRRVVGADANKLYHSRRLKVFPHPDIHLCNPITSYILCS